VKLEALRWICWIVRKKIQRLKGEAVVPRGIFQGQTCSRGLGRANRVLEGFRRASRMGRLPLAEILHTTVQLAVYDAVVAIEGKYEPYASAIEAPKRASLRAAVATAAYRTARERVFPSEYTYLDAQYDSYLADIPDGRSKSDGIQVGEAASAAVLALRANDGFDLPAVYQCSSIPPRPGEFEPNGGCGTAPTGVNIPWITPFTFDSAWQFLPDGPPPLTSHAYATDFAETRDYAAADAIIAGFNAKYAFRFWRPRTAIPRADTDRNPNTAPDPTWTPLLTVNHPEYPAAHAFWSSAVLDTVARFFGTDRVTWTLETSKTAVPQIVQTTRTYRNLGQILEEIGDARVWGGLHYRFSLRDGAKIGRQVARHVGRRYFRETR
jgi:hypothetical protein